MTKVAHDIDTTYQNMQAIIDSYAFWVTYYGKTMNRNEKIVAEKCIDALIDRAAANGMSKDELDELAEVEW